jgi:hypothetical protein
MLVNTEEYVIAGFLREGIISEIFREISRMAGKIPGVIDLRSVPIGRTPSQ